MIDEVSSSTIMGCDFDLIRVGDHSDEQGVLTPILPVPPPSPSQHAASAPPQEQQHLQDEITALKGAFEEEKDLNAKRHEDLLALLTTLQAKLSPPAP